MRLGTVSLVVALVGGLVTEARAQSVAIIDTQKIISESIIGKAAKNNLEGQIKKGQAKLAALKADFEKQRGELEKQSAILSGAALQSRREDLQKKQLEFQKAYEEIQEKLSKANDAEIAKVLKQINEVVEELAEERDYNFVFERDRQAVLYSSEKLDITEDVVKILDKKKVAL